MKRGVKAIFVVSMAVVFLASGQAWADGGGEYSLTEADFTAWLNKLKETWEAGDAGAYAALFTEDATYQEHAFHDKMRGREAIKAYAAHNRNTMQESALTSEVYCVSGNVGLCHWIMVFTLVDTGKHMEVDGILRCVFEKGADKVVRCSELQEWWHIKGTKDYKEMEAEQFRSIK